MNINEIYSSSSDLLKAQDLPAGQNIPVGIQSYEVVKMDDRPKVVLTFTGKDKKLVLNKTNASAIAHVHGDDLDNWVGKEIKLFSTTTEFNGQTVPCIRVTAASDIDEDIPF